MDKWGGEARYGDLWTDAGRGGDVASAGYRAVRPGTSEGEGLLFSPRGACVGACCVAFSGRAVGLQCGALRCGASGVGMRGWLAGCLGGRVDGGRPEGRCPRTLRQREEIQQDDGGWVRQ